MRGRTKRYSGITVVYRVSFQLRPGEILGYVGANGAGKSTTGKMLVGVIEPSDGEIRFHGRNVARDAKDFHRPLGTPPWLEPPSRRFNAVGPSPSLSSILTRRRITVAVALRSVHAPLPKGHKTSIPELDAILVMLDEGVTRSIPL